MLNAFPVILNEEATDAVFLKVNLSVSFAVSFSTLDYKGLAMLGTL